MDFNEFNPNPRPQKSRSGLWITIFILLILCGGVVGATLVGKRVYRHFFPVKIQPPPPVVQNTVRFIEGWSVLNYPDLKDVKTGEQIFGSEELIAAEKSVLVSFDFFGEKVKPKNLEGYLFPDTYFVIKKDGPEVLLEEMLATLGKKLTADIRSQIVKNNMTIFETLTLASIIEKEVGRNESGGYLQDKELLEQERKMVASVFYNRLRIGMPLQSDATVNYVTGKNTRAVTYDDLEVDSRYNTYKYPELPPGPIGNPSISAILAAVYPSKTDYLYFLSKPDGTAVFSKTLDEHNINRAKYLR
jgi:uncharacterized YceG family protein